MEQPPPLPQLGSQPDPEIEKLRKSVKADFKVGVICMAGSVGLTASTISRKFTDRKTDSPPPERSDLLVDLRITMLLIQVLLLVIMLICMVRGLLTSLKLPKDQRKDLFQMK